MFLRLPNTIDQKCFQNSPECQTDFFWTRLCGQCTIYQIVFSLESWSVGPDCHGLWAQTAFHCKFFTPQRLDSISLRRSSWVWMSAEEVKREYRAHCSKCASVYEFLRGEFLHSIQSVKCKSFCKQCVYFHQWATWSLWGGFRSVSGRGRIKHSSGLRAGFCICFPLCVWA